MHTELMPKNAVREYRKLLPKDVVLCLCKFVRQHLKDKGL